MDIKIKNKAGKNISLKYKDGRYELIRQGDKHNDYLYFYWYEKDALKKELSKCKIDSTELKKIKQEIDNMKTKLTKTINEYLKLQESKETQLNVSDKNDLFFKLNFYEKLSQYGIYNDVIISEFLDYMYNNGWETKVSDKLNNKINSEFKTIENPKEGYDIIANKYGDEITEEILDSFLNIEILGYLTIDILLKLQNMPKEKVEDINEIVYGSTFGDDYLSKISRDILIDEKLLNLVMNIEEPTELTYENTNVDSIELEDAPFENLDIESLWDYLKTNEDANEYHNYYEYFISEGILSESEYEYLLTNDIIDESIENGNRKPICKFEDKTQFISSLKEMILNLRIQENVHLVKINDKVGYIVENTLYGKAGVEVIIENNNDLNDGERYVEYFDYNDITVISENFKDYLGKKYIINFDIVDLLGNMLPKTVMTVTYNNNNTIILNDKYKLSYKDFQWHLLKGNIKSDNLRSVSVEFENGDVINTNMAKGLTDDEIYNYYRIGRTFNIGSGGKDLMSKVKSVKILENTNYKDELHDYDVPSHYLSALINGDYDGLSDEEIEMLDKFIVDVISTCGNANFILGDESDNLGFRYKNDINSLGSDVTRIYVRSTK